MPIAAKHLEAHHLCHLVALVEDVEGMEGFSDWAQWRGEAIEALRAEIEAQHAAPEWERYGLYLPT